MHEGDYGRYILPSRDREGADSVYYHLQIYPQDSIEK